MADGGWFSFEMAVAPNEPNELHCTYWGGESGERNALLDSNKIKVKTSGNDVTLTGKVRNYAEKEEAEWVAWAAPGVYSVDDKIKVEWFWGITD